MEWDVLYDETFVAELAEIERQSGSSAVREEIAALALLLRRFGPPRCSGCSVRIAIRWRGQSIRT